jgi:hypothetical protein
MCQMQMALRAISMVKPSEDRKAPGDLCTLITGVKARLYTRSTSGAITLG